MENNGAIIVSVREKPDIAELATDYISSKWTSPDNRIMYEDCIMHCVNAENPLPNWFLAFENGAVVGCCGVIPNDFISRADLMPWLCALYVEEKSRRRGIAPLLIASAKRYAYENGYKSLYIATDHVGLYERYGCKFIGLGYHPWKESSRIYETETKA